ncbi:MAG: polyphosphate kinase 2 family protein [Myxococcota bacterium]
MKIGRPKVSKLCQSFIVEPERSIKLKDRKTGWAQSGKLKKIGETKVREKALEVLEADKQKLAEAQELLYADRRFAMLIVLQGMDTAGKDGTIRHVMSGVNPQGCSVSGFKVPTATEHSHDFLWRYYNVLPARGTIGIFNRSYYEDVLVVKVHPQNLELLPKKLDKVSEEDFWEWRYNDIRNMEKHLARNGTVILKFFLHISKKEQKKRLLSRLEDKEKYWKFSVNDLAERGFWDDYVKAYEEMLPATSTDYAPWFIVPADDKWAARTIVANAICSAIEGLGVKHPEVSADEIKRLMEAKKKLESE